MIKNFSSFASSLIACIIALNLIEIILPSNKTKRYVTFVATLILSIVIINPIVVFLNKDLDIEKVMKIEENILVNNEYESKMEYAKQKSINEMYDEALKQDIINRLEDNGYKVKNISLTVDRESYQPTKMQIEIEHIDGEIQTVIIDVSKNYHEDISVIEIAKIKDILSATYSIDRKNITINNK